MGAVLDVWRRFLGVAAWIELPESYGASLWGMAKGAHHKYVKRVPTGRVTKTGRPVYRYYYAVHRGYGIDHESHFVEGAGFRHGTGHYHIESVDGDKLTIKHDETGDVRTMSRAELSAMLRSEHAEGLAAHASKLRAMHAEALMSGASKKQLARIRTMAERRGVSLPQGGESGREGSSDGDAGVRRPDATGARSGGRDDGGASREAAEQAAVSEFLGPTEATASPYLSDDVGRRQWVPVPSPAITLHQDLAPVPTVAIPDRLKVFPYPNVKKGITQLFSHQIDGAERALTAFQSGDGIIVSDDAGLGKTNTGMATMLGYGGKRNVIVVPTAGKRGIGKQWEETAALYGVPVVRGFPTSETQEGVFIVSYDELTATGDDGKAKPVLHPALRGKWDMVIFDESHNMANPGSIRTKAAMQLQGSVDKALYLSATPFTNIADMHYLTKLGMFKDRPEFLKWAQVAGAQVNGEEVKNPSSPLPMAAIAATLHVDGKVVKRVAQLKGLESRFGVMGDASQVHPTNNRDARVTFSEAERIFEIAVSEGVLRETLVDAFRSSWARQYWETLKVPEAIELGRKAIGSGKQVAFYTSFKSADHAHLRALVNIAERKAGDLAARDKEMDAERMMRVAAQIESIIDKLPPVRPAIRELVTAFGGAGQVAEIHGDTTKKPEEEQRAYQRGEKRIVVATMARGGTGISLHDDEGNAPRVQINLSLPWSGREFNQVAGRSHRLGSRSNTTMHWLVGDDETEKRNAAIVAKRLKSMGSLTVGDPDATIESRQLANWEFGTTDNGEASASDLADAALTAETAEQGGTDEAQAARDYFREYAEARKSGRDVLSEEFTRRNAERQKRVHAAARKALLQLETRFKGFADARKFSPRTPTEDGAYGVPTWLRKEVERAGIKPKGKVGQLWYVPPDALPQLAKDAGVHRVEVGADELKALRDRHGERSESEPSESSAPQSGLAIGDFAKEWIGKFDGDHDRLGRLTSSKLADKYLPAGKRKFWEDVQKYIDHHKAGGESLLKPPQSPPAAPTQEMVASAGVASSAASGERVPMRGLTFSPGYRGLVNVSGNTRPNKDVIKSFGAKWRGNGTYRGGHWELSAAKAEKLKAFLKEEDSK